MPVTFTFKTIGEERPDEDKRICYLFEGEFKTGRVHYLWRKVLINGDLEGALLRERPPGKEKWSYHAVVSVNDDGVLDPSTPWIYEDDLLPL